MAHAGEIFEGRTLDAAVRNGLEALGLSRAEVMITILEEGASGFLGIGARPYRVRVMRRPGGPPPVEGDAETRRRRESGRERRGREHGREGRRDRPRDRGERRVEPREARAEEPRDERRPERAGDRGARRPERPDDARRPRGDRGEGAPVQEDIRRAGVEARDGGPVEGGDGRRRRRGRRGGRRRRGGAGDGGGEAGFARDERLSETSAVQFEAPSVPPAPAGTAAVPARPGTPAQREPVESARRDERRAPRRERDEQRESGRERGERREPGRERDEQREPGRDRGPGLSADELSAQSVRLTQDLLQAMGFEAKVSATVDGDHVEVTAEVAQDDELLTGRKGEVRQALQHLLNRMLNRGESSRYHLQLEINDFWRRREEELRDLARSLAEEAVASDGEVVTEYLNAQERRIVHVTLRDDARVKTYALGTGMIKRVAIAPADFEAGPRDEYE